MALRDDVLASFASILDQCAAAAPELLDELRARLEEAIAARSASAGVAADEVGWHGLVGDSAPMLELRRYIEKFAKAAAPVLITGESGTGKERVARAVHRVSSRSRQEFVAENCAAIPETLLESVLFGHKKGAFTGAVKDHPGHFVAAHKGTLFLDEIGEMSMPMQAKMLRVLQEGEVRAVGDNRVRRVDVRVVAATNQDLEAAVRAGRFREDLYFRLNVLRLTLPPLRERGGDVVELARLFLARACQRSSRSLTLSAGAERELEARRWPGNVRQLENEMQRLAALVDGPEVAVDDLSVAEG